MQERLSGTSKEPVKDPDFQKGSISASMEHPAATSPPSQRGSACSFQNFRKARLDRKYAIWYVSRGKVGETVLLFALSVGGR